MSQRIAATAAENVKPPDDDIPSVLGLTPEMTRLSNTLDYPGEEFSQAAKTLASPRHGRPTRTAGLDCPKRATVRQTGLCGRQAGRLHYFSCSSAALCLFFLWPAVSFAQTNTFKLGPVDIEPHKVREFFVAPGAKARWEANQRGQKVQSVKVAMAVPDAFDPKKTWPLLLVSAPSGGSSVRSVFGYTEVALKAGWVVLAADGPPTKAEQDTFTWGWAMLSSGLEFIHKYWPESKKWPVACAGFSGGAKRSGMIGAIMMKENYPVIGMFMGGCNEDLASLGLRLSQPGEQFKQVPIFLSSGLTDPIATPEQHAAVKQSMQRTGFEKIRLENYEGGHRLDNETLGLALDWFLKQSTNMVPARGLSTDHRSAK